METAFALFITMMIFNSICEFFEKSVDGFALGVIYCIKIPIMVAFVIGIVGYLF